MRWRWARWFTLREPPQPNYVICSECEKRHDPTFGHVCVEGEEMRGRSVAYTSVNVCPYCQKEYSAEKGHTCAEKIDKINESVRGETIRAKLVICEHCETAYMSFGAHDCPTPVVKEKQFMAELRNLQEEPPLGQEALPAPAEAEPPLSPEEVEQAYVDMAEIAALLTIIPAEPQQKGAFIKPLGRLTNRFKALWTYHVNSDDQNYVTVEKKVAE